MSKLARQITALILTAAAMVLLNLSIYVFATSRFIDRSPELMVNKSIELDKYLPFTEDSAIVKMKSDSIRLSGELPVLDGATALFPIYSSFMNAVYPEGSCEFDGDGFTESSLLQKRGTTGAYKAIVDGSADIIFVAQPSAKQLEYASANGIELVTVPIGKEGFVFITNSHNPVDTLTVEQIQGIYSGRYTFWSQVGGERAMINALQRAEGSGSQTALQAFMSEGNVPLKERTTNPLGKSIGFSFRFYVTDIAAKSDIKLLAVNGISPTEENIRNGSYPITDVFYAIYRADNENPNVRLLAEWFVSDEGQYIVNETGYVGIS